MMAAQARNMVWTVSIYITVVISLRQGGSQIEGVNTKDSMEL